MVDGRPSKGERHALSRIKQLRAAAFWVPGIGVAFLVPLISVGWELAAAALAMALGIFSLLMRLAVHRLSCPRCGVRFSAGAGGFRAAWDRQLCVHCGLALFEH